MKFLDYTGVTQLVTGLKNWFALKTEVSAKQDALVSGTNIKTVNGNSLLGSGDLTVSGSSNSGGLLINVTKDGNIRSMDKTAREIKTAFESGILPVVRTVSGQTTYYWYVNSADTNEVTGTTRVSFSGYAYPFDASTLDSYPSYRETSGGEN